MDCTGPLPEPRHYHSASIIDDKMYIFGGTGSNFFNDIHILDLSKDMIVYNLFFIDYFFSIMGMENC